MDIRIGHLNILEHLILALTSSEKTNTDLRFFGPQLSNAPSLDPESLVSSPEIYLQPLNSWEQITRGLESKDINAAFINIPLAMSLFHRGTDIVLLMFTHRGGSRMATGTGIKQIKDFKGKSVLIPHSLSIQHMLLHRFLDAKKLVLKKSGGRQDVCAEAAPSFLMPEMAIRDNSTDIAAIICEEPFGTAAIDSGGARHLLATRDLWPDHPCSALVIHRDLLKTNQATISKLVNSFFRCADTLDRAVFQDQPIDNHLLTAAATFLQQHEDLVGRSLKNAGITYAPELLVPDAGLLDTIYHYLTDIMGLLPDQINLDDFMDAGFAHRALEEINC